MRLHATAMARIEIGANEPDWPGLTGAPGAEKRTVKELRACTLAATLGCGPVGCRRKCLIICLVFAFICVHLRLFFSAAVAVVLAGGWSGGGSGGLPAARVVDGPRRSLSAGWRERVPAAIEGPGAARPRRSARVALNIGRRLTEWNRGSRCARAPEGPGPAAGSEQVPGGSPGKFVATPVPPAPAAPVTGRPA